MSHYEERLQADLDRIRTQLHEIDGRVVQAVHDAVTATVQDDRKLANLTTLRDRAINHGVRSLDRLCHVFVVRHVPTAGHLRWVSSILRLTVALERSGDYAAMVCRETVQLQKRPPKRILEDIEVLGREAERIIRQSVEAFTAGSAELARSTVDSTQLADDAFKRAYGNLVEAGERREISVRDLLGLQVMLRSLKRVSDQGDNICQQTLFTVAGETKDRKVFRILFVDERNDTLSQLAEAYARRAFPESGHYSSAGWRPAEAIPPPIARFLDETGRSIGDRKPRLLAPRDDEDKHYHVIIGLQGDPRPRLETVPFLTASLDWDVGPPPDPGAPDAEGQIQEAYRRLGHRIHELMEMLQGPDAE